MWLFQWRLTCFLVGTFRDLLRAHQKRTGRLREQNECRVVSAKHTNIKQGFLQNILVCSLGVPKKWWQSMVLSSIELWHQKQQPTAGNGAQPKGAGAVDASRWWLQQFDQQGGLPQQQGRQRGHQETLQGRGLSWDDTLDVGKVTFSYRE